MRVGSEGGRVAPERPHAGRWVEGGRHAIRQAARGRSRGQRAAQPGRKLVAPACSEFWWSEMRSAQSAVVRNAMPPVGDTDGGSEEAGDAPHSAVVLPATRVGAGRRATRKVRWMEFVPRTASGSGTGGEHM